mgnify:CR=1 FL=1
MEFLVITGMSGAGKSQAMKVMEDMGYYCMDNLPPQLLPKFAELCYESKKTMEKVAVVVDIRGGEFFNSLFKSLDDLADKGIGYKILFLEASDNVLIKRYKELRRPHPLTPEGSIIEGINQERQMLKELKDRAYYIIDTSHLTIGMLKEEIYKIFLEGGEKRKLTISITSFGYKNGMLMDGDLIFDVRFLPNPYYIPELKEISGINEDIKNYVFKWPQLVVGIGCTGGFHRSVAIANKIGKILISNGHRAIVNHRDINR